MMQASGFGGAPVEMSLCLGGFLDNVCKPVTRDDDVTRDDKEYVQVFNGARR